jgi:amidohydrolase
MPKQHDETNAKAAAFLQRFCTKEPRTGFNQGLIDWKGFYTLLCDIRHLLHEFPETGFKEENTQDFIRVFCENALKIPPKNIKSCGTTGLIVDVCHDNVERSILSKKSGLPILAFRADMDALPIEELNDNLPYVSSRSKCSHHSNSPRNEKGPAAHMCGHDGHMAMVLGLCALIVRQAELLPRDSYLRFIFQPAEEGPGGANVMVKEGALVEVDEIYGLHNYPFPLGTIHVRPGPVMAHETEFELEIQGVSGHGSAPQDCIDPVLVGSHVVVALQSIVSRSLSPFDNAVVSVTQFHAGDANNVIPPKAKLAGTIRLFDMEMGDKLKKIFVQIVNSTCAAFGAKAEINLLSGYPPVVNDEDATKVVIQAAKDANIHVTDKGLPLMAAEDFSYFLLEKPGCFFFLGTKECQDLDDRRALHSNRFDFNDKAIPYGIEMFLRIIQKRLKTTLLSFEEMNAFRKVIH